MSTALVEQKEAIEKASAQQQALFDSMVEGVLVLDRDGRIQMFNRSFQRLFDCNENLRGQPLSAAMPGTEMPLLLARLKKELRVPDFEIVRPGPPDTHFQVNAAAVRSEEHTSELQ